MFYGDIKSFLIILSNERYEKGYLSAKPRKWSREVFSIHHSGRGWKEPAHKP